MKRAILRRSQRLIISLGVLPLLLAIAAYRTSSQHVNSVQETLRTDEVIRSLDQILSTMQDAETGQRGYILTQKLTYLEPFRSAESRIKRELSDLKLVATPGPKFDRDFARLQELVNGKMEELRRTIQLRDQQGFQAALAEVQTNRGRAYMEELRSEIAQWRAQEALAFQKRLDTERRSQRELNVVLSLGAVLGFLLLILSYRFSISYARERDRVEEEIRLLNENLETRVRERTAELEIRTRDLERSSADLQRSNADLMHFAYVASHDLQEPLRMVGSYMGLLSRRYQGTLDETAEKYIRFAVDGANRMQALIQDLLAYSRAGTQAINKQPIRSVEIVQRALENLHVAVLETGARIETGELPEVFADETKLTQVMQNLIGNAIKFRKPDVPPHVVISAKRRGSDWQFEVSDNGIGFDPKYCDRIFQVFQRLHGVGKYPGNGIGLAISRRVIEHHGGRLWAESEAGVGSKFIFTLPAGNEARRNGNSERDERDGKSKQVAHV